MFSKQSNLSGPARESLHQQYPSSESADSSGTPESGSRVTSVHYRTSSSFPHEPVSSPASSGCEGHSPSASASLLQHHPHTVSSPPRPYRGASSPFPLPVGKRSLGGLAALDEQMQAATLGRLSDSDRAEPTKLGMTRCYWTLLSTRGSATDPNDLTFMFCDPVLQSHMGTEKDLLIGKSFFDFVHPQEREQAREDLRNIVASRTLFGSVTRCRYFRVPAIRETLGCANPQRDPEAHLYTSDECYLPIDIVLNMVGDSIALCFFHAVINKTSNDNNEANKSHWTNWCGTPRELYDVEQCNRLWSLVASQDLRPLPSSDEQLPSPAYVFQLLSMPADNSFPEIIFSWPPPRLHTDEHGIDPVRDSYEAYNDGSYFADEFARLAQGVRTSPSAKTQSGHTARNGESGTIQDGANTSCTRRFRAKHTLTTEGMVRSIESVLVPYGTVMLACFNTTYQQKMSRAPAARDLSPARAYTGLPYAPSSNAMYQSASKRNRGSGSPPREGQIGGVSLLPDSVITQPGQPHWPPAVTRPQPLPSHSDARDPQHWSHKEDSIYQSSIPRNQGGHSKRKTGSEEDEVGSPNQSEHVDHGSSGTGEEAERKDSDTAKQGASRNVGNTSNVAESDGEKRCTSCGTSNSPEWRKGPTGQKTLCNACGLRFSRSVSRQQKKENKARVGQQQQSQTTGQQANVSIQSGTTVRPPEEDYPERGRGIAGSGPAENAQRRSESHPRQSMSGYGTSAVANQPSYQVDSEPPRSSMHSSPSSRNAVDIPYIGYGHHTARTIASMGWGKPPDQSSALPRLSYEGSRSGVSNGIARNVTHAASHQPR